MPAPSAAHSSNPLQHAQQLMFGSVWHEEVYLKWTGRRLELDSGAEAAQRADQECLELTHAYGRWCEHQGRFRDCLSLLKNGPLLGAEGRYALAMELALGSVWNETREAFKDMANPEAVRATLVSAMAMYMTLWLLPEPVSKGLAASLTAAFESTSSWAISHERMHAPSSRRSLKFMGWARMEGR
ncbi:hypothetical protein [Archangium sp.]|uniref:hypothetical protein n=1 Tax=Archangium sp. TaxID=1872627 RepID=UPI00389AC35E